MQYEFSNYPKAIDFIQDEGREDMKIGGDNLILSNKLLRYSVVGWCWWGIALFLVLVYVPVLITAMLFDLCLIILIKILDAIFDSFLKKIIGYISMFMFGFVIYYLWQTGGFGKLVKWFSELLG